MLYSQHVQPHVQPAPGQLLPQGHVVLEVVQAHGVLPQFGVVPSTGFSVLFMASMCLLRRNKSPALCTVPCYNAMGMFYTRPTWSSAMRPPIVRLKAEGVRPVSCLNCALRCATLLKPVRSAISLNVRSP